MHPRFLPDGKWSSSHPTVQAGWTSGSYRATFHNRMESYVIAVNPSSPTIWLTEDKVGDSLAF
jgi:hypothetical protein